MSNIKLAMFDLDGTLIDTENQYTEIWKEIGARFHPEIKNLAYVIKGRTLKEILAQYFPQKETQQEVIKMIDEGEARMKYAFFPGALEFVQKLRAEGIKCVVVTSSNDVKMSQVRKFTPGFDSYFDGILTAEMFRASKPDPYCFCLGAAKYGVPKDQCIVFEDAYTGLAAGMASGIRTVAFTSAHTEEELKGLCHCCFGSYLGLELNSLL